MEYSIMVTEFEDGRLYYGPYFREENAVVYRREIWQAEEDVVYDFNWSIGDSLMHGNGYYIVREICNYTSPSGTIRKVFKFEHSAIGGIKMSVIAGVGVINNYDGHWDRFPKFTWDVINTVNSLETNGALEYEKGGAIECEVSSNHEMLKANAKVYPNPAATYVFIDNISPDSHVSIYNLAVQQVAHFEKVEVSVDVSNLDPGVYFMKIVHKGGEQMLRFVKS